ncbi:MAG: hypothetical protein ABSE95_11545 [Thermodesulfobacteriota bacterium]|jgi:hypothetical protein
MINIRKWFFNLLVVLLMVLGSFSWAFGASQEIRPLSQLSGTIVSPVEERKQALSSGDKIFVALDKTHPVKKGDTLEIFQQAYLTIEGKPAFPFVRAGQIIILEIIDERLLLGVIESSIKEIAVGDRIYFPEH